MLVLVTKYNPETGEIEKVRRDLTTAECMDMIHEHQPGAVIACMTFRYSRTRPERGSYKIRAAAKCRKADPVVLEVPGSKKTKYAFRGTTICCGVGPTGEDVDIKKGFLADEYPIEPIYGEDAICIPSVDEWLEIPQRTREILSDDLWSWSRNIDGGEDTTINEGGVYSTISISHSCGAVVAFVNLRRLPSDVADKIRTRETLTTDSETGEILANTACFNTKLGKSEYSFTLVKITNDVYGICAGSRNIIFGSPTSLTRLDPDRTKTYAESELRAHLNGDYLKQLIKYIREH